MVAHILSSISVVAVSMGIFDICYETDYLTIYCPMEKTRKRDFVLLSNEKQIVLVSHILVEKDVSRCGADFHELYVSSTRRSDGVRLVYR